MKNLFLALILAFSLFFFSCNNTSKENKVEKAVEKVELYGGIKGSLSSTTAFNASASYSNISNMALFVNDKIGRAHV